MSYSLGVDLGTTFVAAAVSHGARVEMFTLGDRAVVAPAVVFARDDGSIVTGEAANRRAVSSPERVGRGFKRRLGDPTPVMLGGSQHAVTSLLAGLLFDAVSRVTATEGAPPDQVILTHPANWGPYRRELFEEVPQLAGVAHAQMVTEPEAAAAYYAAARHLGDGETVGVYDLGGGTFDATVLRKHAVGIDILGTPEGIERLGGDDFDDAILAHVNVSSGGALSELDLSNPQTGIALARLRQDCTLAKEALTVDTDATIPVFLPNRLFDVRLTRTEFEDMIRAQVESTIGALTRTLRSARVEPAELDAVLLVGGSSRIPLVGRMITEALDRPTLVDAHPKYAVALGAAALASELSPGSAGHNGNGTLSIHTRQPDDAAIAGVSGDRVGGMGRTTAALGAVGTPVHPDPPPPTAEQARAGPGSAEPVLSWPAGSLPRNGQPGRPTGRGQPLARADQRVPDVQAVPPDGGASPGGTADPRRRALVIAAAVAALLVLAAAIVSILLGNQGIATVGEGPRPSVMHAPHAQPPPQPPGIAPSVPIPAIGGEVPVGETPGFVVIAPSGRSAYVANRAAGVITVVDTTIDQAVATIPIPDGPPQYLAFAPDGTRLYVSVFNDPDGSINRVAVLDTRTNTVLTTIEVGTRPYALDVSPDGSQIYVPNSDSGTVSVIDAADDTRAADIQVQPNPHGLEFSKDGTRAYTANHESNLVSVIDTATRTVATEIPVQVSPHSVAVHPTQPLVANVNYDSNSVTMIDTNTEQVIATVPVGTHPQDLTWAPDGRHLYVTNVDSDTMTVIALDGYRVTATIPTGEAPTSVAVLPDGTKAYVSNLNSGTLTVLDLAG